MKGFIKEFKEFISRGNVIDLAVAVVIGGAFTKIVNSLVNDIIMPSNGIPKTTTSELTSEISGSFSPNQALSISEYLLLFLIITSVPNYLSLLFIP